ARAGPRVERVDVGARRRVLAEHADELADRRREGDEREQRAGPGRRLARDPRAGQRERSHAGERREQADPGERLHQWRNPVSRSTSRSPLRRATATTMPRPTTTSDAATAITT